MVLVKRFSWYLLSPIIHGCLQLVLLPLTTYILDPEDFGAFSLVFGFTNLGTMVASLGSGILLAEKYPVLEKEEQCELISSIIYLGIFVLVIYTSFLAFIWPLLGNQWNIFDDIPFTGVIIAFVTMIVGFPWMTVTHILILDGKARFNTLFSISSALCGSIAVLLSLYYFK